MDPKVKEEAFKAARETVVDGKKLIRDALEAADAHPLGHILCEMGRAKVQKRTLSAEEILDLALEAMGK